MKNLSITKQNLPYILGQSFYWRNARFYKSFHLVVTSFLIVAIILSNFANAVLESKNNIQSNLPSWTEDLKKMISSETDLETNFNNLEVEFELSLRPLTGFLLNKYLISKDINRVKNLSRGWLEAIKPLFQYTFDSRGFVNKTSSEKFITTDIQHFIDLAENLLRQTKQLYNDFWIYRDLAVLVGRSNWVETLDTWINLMSNLIKNKDIILNLLGGNSTQRIVVFNQNPGEARPTGGFIGSYIPIDLFRGRVSIGQSQSIYHVDGNKKDHFYTHPASWYYDYSNGDLLPRDIHNSNYYPCFWDSAQFLESEFSKSNNGYSIDQVIMITPQLLQNVLPASFKIEVSKDLVLNPSNLMLEIERLTSLESTDPSNPKAALTKILESLFSAIPSIVEKSGLSKFIGIFWEAISSRDLQIWSKNQSQRDLLKGLGISSDKVCANNYPDKDIMTFLLANISGDKRGLITQNQFSMTAKLVGEAVEINLKYKQILPDNPSQQLQRGFNEYNPLTFIGLQVPSKAFDLNVNSSEALLVPFLRKYYREGVKDHDGKEFRLDSGIDTVISTSRDLYSTDGSKPGFKYTQPDFSQVLGIYISDKQVSTVDFSFKLPKSDLNLIFYNQPGMNAPVFSLGAGVLFKNFKEQSIIDEYSLLSQGLALEVY